MRIAIVAPPLIISGGAQRQAIELALGLMRLGHGVHVFSHTVDKDSCYPDIIKHLNCHVTGLINYDAKSVNGNLLYKLCLVFIRLFANFVNVCSSAIKIHLFENKTGKFDVINYHDASLGVSFFFNKRRNVWMMNDLPGILDGEFKGLVQNPSFAMKLYIYLARIWLIFLCSGVKKIVVLDFMNQRALGAITGVSASVLRSGIDLSAFSSNQDHSNYGNGYKYKILSTSIFFRHRRYEDAIEALALLINRGVHNFRYDIIGRHDTDLTYFTEIIKLVEKRGIAEYVNFLGAVSESDLRRAYSNADIFLFPNAPQTWGLAVFEAMASGCATVVTDGCGAHEVLNDGVDACIALSHNPKSIADILEHLISDPTMLIGVGQLGEKKARSLLSWDKYSKDMETIFKDSCPYHHDVRSSHLR